MLIYDPEKFYLRFNIVQGDTVMAKNMNQVDAYMAAEAFEKISGKKCHFEIFTITHEEHEFLESNWG